MMFDVQREIEALRAQPSPGNAPQTKVLLRQPSLRLVLVALDTGGRLDRHRAPGAITIHVLDGQLRVQVNEQEQQLTTGQLLHIDAGVPHDVAAPEPSAFLLTIAWPLEAA